MTLEEAKAILVANVFIEDDGQERKLNNERFKLEIAFSVVRKTVDFKGRMFMFNTIGEACADALDRLATHEGKTNGPI